MKLNIKASNEDKVEKKAVAKPAPEKKVEEKKDKNKKTSGKIVDYLRKHWGI